MKALLPLLTLLLACSGPAAETGLSRRDLMKAQETAWSRGDLRAFLEPYAEDALFSGSSGITRGRSEIYNRYKRSYPDAEAMGNLRFEVIDDQPLTSGQSWMCGTWTLFRTADTLKGGFALLWEQDETGRWEIIADYSH